MRRLTIALLLLSFAVCASAGKLGYSKDNPLIFGIDMDYAPMEYVDDKGIPHGFDVEFTQILMKRLDIPFTYAPNTWENIADDVLHGKVDLGMMVYSPYRQDLTNYSRAVFRLYYQIVTRETDNGNYGLRDVAGKTIALMSSRPIVDTLTKVGAKPYLVKDLSMTMKELSQGKYDAVICFRYQAHYFIKLHHLDNLIATDLALTPREYCYVSPDKRLINAINIELDKMEEENVIDDVYGNVKSTFGGTHIPKWIWVLIAGVIFVALIIVIVLQRLNRKRILMEMDRAKKSEELKDIFLSNLSHALRTPLNAIIGFSDLMMSTPKENMAEEEKVHLLGLINSNGLQLLHFINELLSLSDIEGKNQLFERQVIDVDEMMSSCAFETRLQLKNQSVEVNVQAPTDGVRALTDPKLLKLVTMHLLENSSRHTSEGQIILSYCTKEGGLYVEVRDTGSGIPENLKQNIFQLLSDKNTYLQNETPGLGLSICKAIVDKAGGHIGARDNDIDGRGTVVWYWAPVKILS